MRSSFWKGFAILILAPTLVLVALAGIVHGVNAFEKGGHLSTMVSPQVVLPGGNATFFITFDGNSDKAAPKPRKPLDIAFLIDISGSMRESLPFMAEAAAQAAREMHAALGDRVRFALIKFDSASKVLTDWTQDPNQLIHALQDWTPMADGTDPSTALEDLGGLMKHGRPGARTAGIFYTDGLFQCVKCLIFHDSTDSIVKTATQLREAGVEFYDVGLPGTDAPPVMLEITGDRAHIFQPTDMSEMARSFLDVAMAVSDVVGNGSVLTHRIDGRYFEAPLRGTPWQLDTHGRLRLELGALPSVPSTFTHPLRPTAAGLWRIGVEPVALYFLKDTQQVVELRASNRPAVLVLTWWTLFFYLPALIWALVHLLPHHTEPEPEVLPPPIIRPLAPPRLPALPALPEARIPVVPTLFLSLGETGKAALDEVIHELRQVHASSRPAPYVFRHLDVAELSPAPAHESDEFDPVLTSAPRDVQRVADYLPQRENIPKHLSWFDARKFEHASRERLNLVTGSQGDRLLARFALHRWLGKFSFVADLGSHLDALLALPSSDGTRQIVFLISARGGFGTGAVVDLARIFTRLARDRQQNRGGFVPEVLVVLCDDQSDRGAANYAGLLHELSSVVLTGEFPRQVTFLPGDPLLDRTDSESPIHWVFRVAAADGAVLPVASAQLAALLVERRSRTRILEQATRLLSSPATSVPILDATLRTIAIRPTLLADLVKSSLLLRLLGPDVLLDIVPKSSGGYVPRQFSEDELLTLLSNWISDESAGSPMATMLAALREPQETARWNASVQSNAFADDNWTRNAFLFSLNRQLAGRPARDCYGWTRLLMPSSAAAILALLESRLTEVETRLPKTPESARARNILVGLRPVLAGSAASMGVWIQAFCSECETIGALRTGLRDSFTSASKASLVRYLDPPDLFQADEEWSRQVLRRWLASSDSDALLQQRLFFCAEWSQAGVAVFVRSLIEESVRLDSAGAVIALFSHLAESLTSYIPERTVVQALERLAGDQQR
jgi:hypothetical protein